jgi:hypothetical protein
MNALQKNIALGAAGPPPAVLPVSAPHRAQAGRNLRAINAASSAGSPISRPSAVMRASLGLCHRRERPAGYKGLPAGQQRSGLLAGKTCHWTPGLKVVGSVQDHARSRP